MMKACAGIIEMLYVTAPEEIGILAFEENGKKGAEVT